MLEKWRNHHVLLLAALTAVSSGGFAEAQVETGEQATSLSSKLFAMLKSSGVATLSVGPVWESTGNTQTFYLAPNIEKTYSANGGIKNDGNNFRRVSGISAANRIFG